MTMMVVLMMTAIATSKNHYLHSCEVEHKKDYHQTKLNMIITIIRRSWVCRKSWRSWAERGCTIIIFLIFPFLFTKQSSYSLYFLYCLLNKILQGCTARVRTNWLWTARSSKPAFRGCPSATRSYWWPQLHFWRKDVDWYLMKCVF